MRAKIAAVSRKGQLFEVVRGFWDDKIIRISSFFFSFFKDERGRGQGVDILPQEGHLPDSYNTFTATRSTGKTKG